MSYVNSIDTLGLNGKSDLCVAEGIDDYFVAIKHAVAEIAGRKRP